MSNMSLHLRSQGAGRGCGGGGMRKVRENADGGDRGRHWSKLGFLNTGWLPNLVARTCMLGLSSDASQDTWQKYRSEAE